jgi:hypothetical protein
LRNAEWGLRNEKDKKASSQLPVAGFEFRGQGTKEKIASLEDRHARA